VRRQEYARATAVLVQQVRGDHPRENVLLHACAPCVAQRGDAPRISERTRPASHLMACGRRGDAWRRE